MQQLSLLGDEPASALPVISKRSAKKTAQPELVLEKPAEPDFSETKDAAAFKNISEAANMLDVPQHVLRFWESRFTQIKPLKLRGGRRYYRPEDMEILTTIKNLLYKQGYTIEGAKKAFGLLRGRVKSEKKTKPPVVESEVSKRMLTDKKREQISAIRNELIGLRKTLQTQL